VSSSNASASSSVSSSTCSVRSKGQPDGERLKRAGEGTSERVASSSIALHQESGAAGRVELRVAALASSVDDLLLLLFLKKDGLRETSLLLHGEYKLVKTRGRSARISSRERQQQLTSNSARRRVKSGAGMARVGLNTIPRLRTFILDTSAFCAMTQRSIGKEERVSGCANRAKRSSAVRAKL
jgi:hypothetical protein